MYYGSETVVESAIKKGEALQRQIQHKVTDQTVKDGKSKEPAMPQDQLLTSPSE